MNEYYKNIIFSSRGSKNHIGTSTTNSVDRYRYSIIF